MNKIGVIVIILLVIGGLAAGFYFLFMTPSGYTDPELLVNDYLNNLEDCDTYYIEDTLDICEHFSDAFSEIEYTVDNVSYDDFVTVTLTINETETTFIFILEETEVEGLEGILNDTYYKIKTWTD